MFLKGCQACLVALRDSFFEPQGVRAGHAEPWHPPTSGEVRAGHSDFGTVLKPAPRNIQLDEHDESRWHLPHFDFFWFSMFDDAKRMVPSTFTLYRRYFVCHV